MKLVIDWVFTIGMLAGSCFGVSMNTWIHAMLLKVCHQVLELFWPNSMYKGESMFAHSLSMKIVISANYLPGAPLILHMHRHRNKLTCVLRCSMDLPITAMNIQVH